MLRTEEEDTTKKMSNMQVHGKGRRGGNKRWLHYIRDDMKEYSMTEDIAQNRGVWHMMTKGGPSLHGGDLQVRR